jgi:hypothetical protein
MNIETITTISSGIGILVALIALMIQTRQNNRALQISLLRDLDKEFFQDMKCQRLELARFLINRKPNQAPDGSVADMLDFFDGIGIYLSKGALDEETVFYALYYWIKPYWQLLDKDATYFEDITNGIANYSKLKLLVDRLTRIANKKKKLRRGYAHSYTDEQLQKFLQEEIEQCLPMRLPDIGIDSAQTRANFILT